MEMPGSGELGSKDFSKTFPVLMQKKSVVERPCGMEYSRQRRKRSTKIRKDFLKAASICNITAGDQHSSALALHASDDFQRLTGGFTSSHEDEVPSAVLNQPFRRKQSQPCQASRDHVTG